MVNRVEANITGYSSNSKTQTAGDVAAFINRRITLEDNRQPGSQGEASSATPHKSSLTREYCRNKSAWKP